MAGRLIWSPRALDDVNEIASHIARDSPFHARNVARRLFARANDLPDQPGQGRLVPEYEGARELREVFVHRWRMIYQVSEVSIEVIAIVHGARLLGNAGALD